MNDTKTVSGAIVHVTDADEAPLVRCLVDITPKQSGTGTPSPSNVRAISGWESVSVNVTGKNILENGFTGTHTAGNVTITANNDGSITASGTATSSQVVITNFETGSTNTATQNNRKKHIPNGRWTIRPTQNSGIKLQVCASNSDSPNADVTVLFNNSAGSFTIDDTYAYNWVRLLISNGTVTDTIIYPMIVKDGESTDTYAPYNGHTTTTSLGRTVYGGTLDVVTGVLTVDRACVTITNSTESMSMSGGNKRAYLWAGIPAPKKPTSASEVLSNLISNYLTAKSDTQTYNGTVGVSVGTNGYLGFTLTGNTMTLDEVKAYLAQNPLQVCYELATPQTYTLTGQEINTLLGDNNVWANSGDVEITYRTNTLGIYNKIYINGRPYFRPNDFEIKREDVYAGEYTTCTGKLIADKIGWKYSDLPMKWDILPDEDLVYLTTLTGAFDLIFRDSDGQHTEQVIRRAFINTPTSTTGPEGTKIWTGVEMEVSFLNTHPIENE